MSEALWPHARPLAVHCLLSGPARRQVASYHANDVYRLQRALQQHMPVPYWFVVHTDRPLALLPCAEHEVAQIQTFLDHGFGLGWWAKLGLWHGGGVAPHHRALFLDLDTIIVGSLDPIVAALGALDDGHALWLSDFYAPARIASGVMAWTPGWAAGPGEAISRQALVAAPSGFRGAHGDQDFAAMCKPQNVGRWQDVTPGAIVSYKGHVTRSRDHRSTTGNEAVPEGACVVCFHGKPKPHDLVKARPPQWLRSNWWAPGDAWGPIAMEPAR